MATLQELFDRLSGIALVRERLADVKSQVEDHRRLLIDHERRLAQIEARSRGSPRPRSRR